MRIRFQYRNYPLSPELTQKSRRIGVLTHPIYGVMLGVVPGILGAMLFPSSAAVPLILMFAGMIGDPILLSALRKKKFAQYDAEYERLVQSMQQ